MCRLMTSIVSVVSNFVAKNHQAMHHVSCSPSKIPYVGFSPVRLQAGIQTQPSLLSLGLSTEPAYLHDTTTYIRPKAMQLAPVAPKGMSDGTRHRDDPTQRPLARQGVMLSHWVNAYYDLIRNSLTLPPAYLLRPSGSLPYGSVWAKKERLPNLLHVSVLPCRRPYPGRSSDCVRLVLRHSHWPSPIREQLGTYLFPSAGSRRGGLTRLQRSLNATARKIACPTPARTFTTKLSPPLGHPNGALVITTRASSRLPGPDSHRLDTRPYGLRHELTQINTKLEPRIDADFCSPRNSMIGQFNIAGAGNIE